MRLKTSVKLIGMLSIILISTISCQEPQQLQPFPALSSNIPSPLPPGSNAPLPLPPGSNAPLPLPPGSNAPLPLPPGSNQPSSPPPADPIEIPKLSDLPQIPPPLTVTPTDVEPILSDLPQIPPPLTVTPNDVSPIKIHAILITDDESLQRVPVVATALTDDQENNARASGALSEISGSSYGDISTAQAAVKNMIADLNEDFYKLYPKNYWPGFELKKVSVRYDKEHAKTHSLQENTDALTALSTVGLTDHLNLFISDLNESGSQGVTLLSGNIMANKGAPILLSNSAMTATFIHEMGHVIGVEHIAGTIPPSTYKPGGRPGYKLDLPDGSVFGYSSMDHSNPENSHMSGWTENVYDPKSGFEGSLYLTNQTQSLLSPTYGRLFSEALRTWLINNHVIGLDSPRTGYTGVDTDNNRDATAFWSWGNEIIPTHPTLLKQLTYRNVFQDCVVNAVGPELASEVEIIVLSGEDHISVGMPSKPEFEKVYACTDKYFLGKDSSILDELFLQIPDELQAIFPNLATSSSNYNQAAAAWESGDSTAVRLGYRNSDGVWQKTESFTRDNNIIESSISMNAKGEALAIWTHWKGPGIETAYHGADKEKWNTPLLISEATSQSAVTKRSRVAINDNGEAAAIWLSKADTDAETQLIFKSRSAEGVWSKTLVLQQTGQLIELPALALNNNGDALVTWQEMSSQGTFTIKGRYHIGTNKYWSKVETYSNGSKHAGFAQPALNSDGNALIYWREADTDTAQLITLPFKEFKILSPSAHLSVRSRTADGLLGTVHQLSPDGNDAFNSAVEVPDHNIVFTDKGEAVAVWHAFDGNDYRIYVARMNIDGVWGAPVALSKSGHHAKLPSMAIADDGSIAVTWQRSDGLHSRIRGSIFNSGLSQWSEPISLSKSGAPAFWSNISFDGNGKFTVLWSRYNNGSYIVESKQGELVQ